MSDSAPIILNVNDSETARYLVSRILKNAGYAVVEATTGGEALLAVERHRPGLIVLDMRLPDLSGFDVCKAVKANPANSSIAVLATSATFVDIEGKVRGLDSGADAYLTQPFESIELVAMTQALLRMRKGEHESRRRAEELIDAGRRKDEFLAMLAHELRNPLAAIATAVRLFSDAAATDTRVARGATTIERQTRHLARLIDDLLDVSRITRGTIQLKRETVDFARAIRSTVDSHQHLFQAREIELVARVPDEAVGVNADPTRLEQIVSNLLVNAAKYTQSGGHVTVWVEATAAKATLRVCDDGIGIPPLQQSSIFDLFYQVDGSSLARTRGGLGIGLTMVRRLCELHGGSVRVRSDGEGCGTEFVVELPRTDAPITFSPTARTETRSQVGARKRRVLLVDDNVDACELLQIAIEHWGHTVDTAFDGVKGLELATSGNYDVAIVDIGLPRIDGYQLARQVREARGDRRPRLVALTGYSRAEDRDRARAAGFDVHLAKPVDLDEIERLIDELARNSEPPQLAEGR